MSQKILKVYKSVPVYLVSCRASCACPNEQRLWTDEQIQANQQGHICTGRNKLNLFDTAPGRKHEGIELKGMRL